MNIIITGAGKGIGLSLCKKFLKEKHKIIAISRNVNALNALQSQNLLPLSFDLVHSDYQSLIEKLNFFPNQQVDILINNAGYLVNKSFEETVPEDLDIMLEINFKAPYKIVQTLLPHFSENAHIVNIGSMGGFQGSVKFKGLSGYSASKAALACLTECLAEELKTHNIKTNCLCLGAVQTEMLESAFPGYKAPVTPDEMAEYIAVFALYAHKYMNGKIIPVSLSIP